MWLVDSSLASVNPGCVYTTGCGMTQACICRCKFELPVWDTGQQYSHGKKEPSMAGSADAKQVYRWCWALSCGGYTARNVRIWQKLLPHMYLHWEQLLLELQRRGTFGDCAPAIRCPASRSCALPKLPPGYSALQHDYSQVLWFISTIYPPPFYISVPPWAML